VRPRRILVVFEYESARCLEIHRSERFVYVEEFDSRLEAMRREREVKLLSHFRNGGLVRSGMQVRARCQEDACVSHN
jgi:predicted GIY-YIG superfamily endonuclease